MPIKQCKFRMLYCHYCAFRSVIRKAKYSFEGSQQCAIKLFNSIQYKTIIRFRFVVFLFKSVNSCNLSAPTKSLRANYIFFVKPRCFYKFEKQESNDNLLKQTLIISNKYQHSGNVFYCKAYTRGVFRTRSNIKNKTFL